MMYVTIGLLGTRMDRAATSYGPIASTHEALGVILEELDELLAAIRANDMLHIRDEALDLAAIAIRLAETASDPDSPMVARSGK